MEESAIERVANYYGCDLEKNEINLENEFFTGTYDAKNLERVIDTKVPFDAFTFPFFVEKPDTDYYAQLQIYMELTGLKKASLCYCLENGSDEQIERLSWQIAKDLEGAKKALKEKKITLEAVLEKYDLTDDQLKQLQDETV